MTLKESTLPCLHTWWVCISCPRSTMVCHFLQDSGGTCMRPARGTWRTCGLLQEVTIPASEKTPSKEMPSSCQEGPITEKKLTQQMPVPRRQACPLTLDCPFLELTELLRTHRSRNLRLYTVLSLKEAWVCLRVAGRGVSQSKVFALGAKR